MYHRPNPSGTVILNSIQDIKALRSICPQNWNQQNNHTNAPGGKFPPPTTSTPPRKTQS